MGQLVNISNTGILIESDFALMPGNSVTFELCRGAADAPAVDHPSGLIVPAHIVRSEVSKVGPNALHYLVAAKFSSDLELLPSALTGSPATDFSDPQDHATAINGHAPRHADEALHDLARALEGLESAISRMGAERQGALVESDDRSTCRERADAARTDNRQLTTGN
jgi:hypothetical protein